jgi:hypothetical protein
MTGLALKAAYTKRWVDAKLKVRCDDIASASMVGSRSGLKPPPVRKWMTTKPPANPRRQIAANTLANNQKRNIY